MTWAYYNEHDPFAAAWLRELIRDNLIAPGEVDERSIEDVTPDELRSFRQCHFFAGIGVWSLAARQAGIPDNAPLWSGSCPCQPFSAAGQGGGFADERHLWPAFFHIIEQCGPTLVVGEQVAGADGDAWLDLVSADLDATGYAFGAAETVAAGFGAPHKRSRNYWLAHRLRARLERHAGHGDDRDQPGRIGSLALGSVAEGGLPHGLADDTSGGRGEERPHLGGIAGGDSAQGRGAGFSNGGGIGGLGLANDERHEWAGRARGRGLGLPDDGAARGVDNAERDGRGSGRNDHGGHVRDELNATDEHGARIVADAQCKRTDRQTSAETGSADTESRGIRELSSTARQNGSFDVRRGDGRPGPVNGYWHDADWLSCRDEKWRPVESGTFPLVDAGTFRNRVGLLRGAGNAINLAQAEGFFEAVVTTIGRWW